ncbi:hypothetical protein JW848_05405 [Candidatus Bipolaricaulota bacterium]|nr:hypothetical protein [Candidatus Bipolaricaulota bacterium]
MNHRHQTARAIAFATMVPIGLIWLGMAGLAAAPDEPGAYAVGELNVALEDEVRDREMALLVLYPIGHVSTDSCTVQPPFPLVVFNHGFLLRADGYRSYGEHLASHGFVVAMPSFPMTFFNVDHGDLALDVHFVVDTVLALKQDPASPLADRIDATKIGASGHSLGAKLSLLEAVSDERIRAIGVLDPVDTGNPLFNNPRRYPSVAPELMPLVEVPLLFIGAERGSELVSFSPCAPAEDNYQRFYEAANSPAIEITQLDVGHGQYVDPGAEAATMACAVGEVPDEWVRSSSVSYLTAFFLGALMDDAQASVWLEQQLVTDEKAGRIVVRRK